MPKPARIASGYKFAINCDGRLVSVTLNPKAWDKLVKAASSHEQWVAWVTGKMGPSEGNGFALLGPNIQVFEKKPKEVPPKTKTVVDDLSVYGKGVKAAQQKPTVGNSRFGGTLALKFR